MNLKESVKMADNFNLNKLKVSASGSTGNKVSSKILKALERIELDEKGNPVDLGCTAFEIFCAENPKGKYIDPNDGKGTRTAIRTALSYARKNGYFAIKFWVNENWHDNEQHTSKKYFITKDTKLVSALQAKLDDKSILNPIA